MNRHSVGISYKPRVGEVGMCPRVGRMGPIKGRWPGTALPGPEREPTGGRATAAGHPVVVSGRGEIVVLYERWRRTLRSRLVGGGFKLP